jgi:hypothetical protein
MKFLRRPAKWTMKWKLLTALSGMFLAHTALATIPLYQNFDVLQYVIPGTPPPTIDATAFDNENLFEVEFAAESPFPEFYEPWNTVYYTNFSLMIANGPLPVNNEIFSLGSFGVGFQFDTQTTNLIPHQMAGTFYNPGQIRCDSFQDGNIFDLNIGQCVVSATNIIMPGIIDVGTGGLLQLGGGNVDLDGGQLTVETLFGTNLLGTFGEININSTGVIGIDTNGDWDPNVDLTPTEAFSSDISIAPFQLVLTNSQCYVKTSGGGGNNLYRCIFVENNSPNVAYKVYVEGDDPAFPGTGTAYVEWDANYTDPATGNPVTGYLYMNNDYLESVATNDLITADGYPENFEFFTSPVPIFFDPLTTSFPGFPDLIVTNRYAYMNGVLTAATVATNASLINPSGNITNLPGAFKINANNELTMSLTTVAAPNYMSLNCTNQFDGSPGASISVPYSDIRLGVTNGMMVVSNLLVANIQDWSGTIQAFSTDFTNVTLLGVTNEYRVLLVFSQLQPTTVPWIQNLYLHGTNSLLVSDALNVYGSFYSDARNLTLTTNYVGNGATSLAGVLNWFNTTAFNANTASGTQQMPNLRWFTNNGAFYALNTANFGQPQIVTNPSMPAVAATGKLSEAGTNAVKLDQVVIGTNHYTFVGTITNKSANQIKIAATFDGTMSNLIAAINHAAGSGSTYSTNTSANPQARAGSLVSHAFTVTAITNGAIGNTIVTLFTPRTLAVNLTWNGHATLTGGDNFVPVTTNGTFALSSFINNTLVSDQGTALWTTNFLNDGTVSNGTGSFSLLSMTALLTNGSVVAGGDVTLVATNSLIVSDHMIQAGRKLTLVSTNLTDTGVTNGNIWVVGASSGGGTIDSGFNAPFMPAVGAGDLLGTTVTNIAPPSKSIYNVWAGTNYGISTSGYSDNLALGQLILDAQSSSTVIGLSPPSFFYFSGAGSNNALYVDNLILMDSATNSYNTNSYNFQWLKINTNMFIYYAQASHNGISVAEKIDLNSQHGANGGRLRWIYSYAGYFSSTNLVFPPGTTNTVNAALAQSTTIDSNGNGIHNADDPDPFFLPTNINFTLTTTDLPPLSAKVEWMTIPNATNFIYYTTNLLSGTWLAFTNFKDYYYGDNVAVNKTNTAINPAATNNYFISPQPAPGPATNVWVYDAITNVPHYYKVVVWPWLNYPE